LKGVRAVGGSSENVLAADSQGRDWPYSGVHLAATSCGSSGPCVGYQTSEPCLALAVEVGGHHLESIVRKTLVRK
jgi:hypothetical protein